MDKTRYIDLCVVEFGKRDGMPTALVLNHPDTLADLAEHCKRCGGTMA